MRFSLPLDKIHLNDLGHGMRSPSVMQFHGGSPTQRSVQMLLTSVVKIFLRLDCNAIFKPNTEDSPCGWRVDTAFFSEDSDEEEFFINLSRRNTYLEAFFSWYHHWYNNRK